MADHSNMKLGRKAIRTDSRTLALGDYLTSTLPPPPPSKDWTCGNTSWGMMANDKLGDCTIAGIGHAIQVWSACTGGEITVADSTVVSYYETWDGYNPADPTTDRGGIELDVLNNWHKQPFDGHNLVAFADPKYTNLLEIRQSIALFGGVYIGMALTITRMCGMWCRKAARTPRRAAGAATACSCRLTTRRALRASPGAG